MEKNEWKALDNISIRELNEAMGYLHQAAQLVAAVNNTYISKKEDDSHTNMEWLPMDQALAGGDLGNGNRLGISASDFSLKWFDGNEVTETFSLSGKTLVSAWQWIEGKVKALGKAEPPNWKMHYEIPAHGVNEGASFKQHADANECWSRLRHNADAFLKKLAQQYEHASSVRVWPHHYDTGTYIPLQLNAAGDAQNSISLGFGIADEYLPEPYYYITHWSATALTYPGILPALTKGQWNEKDWVGAVLPVSKVLELSSGEAQKKIVEEFFDNGIKVSLGFLGL